MEKFISAIGLVDKMRETFLIKAPRESLSEKDWATILTGAFFSQLCAMGCVKDLKKEEIIKYAKSNTGIIGKQFRASVPREISVLEEYAEKGMLLPTIDADLTTEGINAINEVLDKKTYIQILKEMPVASGSHGSITGHLET